MSRAYYYRLIDEFLLEDENAILGELTGHHEFILEEQQRNAWQFQIKSLKQWLVGVKGAVIFEYSIPRMGKRIDCVVLSGSVIFAIEFKVGSAKYENHAIDQVLDYALDLKNFHEQSHNRKIVPVLICNEAERDFLQADSYADGIVKPILSNGKSLAGIIARFSDNPTQDLINPAAWADSIYKPTPTIIEAAQALYQGHSVEDISRSDSGTINLSRTAKAIDNVRYLSHILKTGGFI